MKPTRSNRLPQVRKADDDRSIFEFAPIGIYQCTIYQFIAGNPTLARMFGYHSAPEMAASVEVPGELFVDFDQERSAIRAAAVSRKAIQRQVEFIRRDGSTFAGNLCMKAVRDPAGKLKCFDVFIEDLTARKRAESERLKMLLALERENPGRALPVNRWRSGARFELWRNAGVAERTQVPPGGIG